MARMSPPDDVWDWRPLTRDEVLAVLRAADDLVGAGGRTLLAKVLRGSRDKRVLEHGLDKNPFYGYWRHLTEDQVLAHIDQCICRGFLKTVMSGRLPVLVFTPLGWDLERGQRVEEWLREWDKWLENGISPLNMEYLKGQDRQLVEEFLERVARTGNPRYIPFLKQWEAGEVKKVRAMIRRVIAGIQQASST